MATVKSKLKEALQDELDNASVVLRNNPQSIIAPLYYDSIKRLIKVCEDRKRY